MFIKLIGLNFAPYSFLSNQIVYEIKRYYLLHHALNNSSKT